MALVVLLRAEGLAAAHPEGASSVDRYLSFQRTYPGEYRVAYRLDFAEAAALVELDALDENHDGSVTPDEQRRYLASRIPHLVSEWNVQVNGARVVPDLVASHLDLAPGQGGALTMQIDCELHVEGPPPAPRAEDALLVRDPTFVDRPGSRVIVAGDAGGSSAPVLASARDAGSTAKVPRTLEASFAFRPLQRRRAFTERLITGTAIAAPIVALAGLILARGRRERRAVG